MASHPGDSIESVARELFGLTGRLHPLAGELDRNFRLEGPEGSYVLKLSPLDRRGTIDLSVQALAHLSRSSLSVPRPIPLSASAPVDEGPYIAPVTVSGIPHLASALSYVPGIPLAEAPPASMPLMRAVGTLLGSVDRALADFDHEALDRDFPWKLDQGLETLESRLEDLRGEDRELVARVAGRSALWMEGIGAELPSGVIHNDANDYNLIVTPGTFGPELAGLIDFGDMVRGWRVAEAAVAAAYLMLDRPDPLGAACAIAGGYAGVLPLTEPECASLVPLAALRMCLSVAIQARQIADQPDNEYLTVSQAPARRLLAWMDAADWHDAECRIRAACGHRPVSTTSAVVRWIDGNRGATAAPVDPSLLTDPVLIDLSVESLDLPHPEEVPNDERLDRWVFDRIQEAGGTVGIGRYAEARLVYADPAFQEEGDPIPEARTIHMGLDLFLPAGTPIRATVDGEVAGIVDNRGHLDYGPTVVLRHSPEEAPPFHTLYGHLSRKTLDHLSPGQAVRAGDLIGWLGDRSVNGGWTPHLHLQLVTSNTHGPPRTPERLASFPGVARPSLFPVWEGISPNPRGLSGVARGPLTETATQEGRRAELADRRARHMGPSLSVSYQNPIHVVRGLGATLFDSEGRDYLDTVNNVAHVGHCNRRVVNAISRQSRVLNTNTRYLHDGILDLSERLIEHFPPPLEVVFLVCSGSEANELALRMARVHTGHSGVVVVEGAYHGNTTELIRVSPYKFDGPGGEGRPPGVAVARSPDPYRTDATGDELARDVARALDELGEGGPAAFLCESILSCGGQIEPPEGYLTRAYEEARRRGAVCIADEVQVGFGRVGDSFWGFQLQGVVPDIVTLGKPMGNGHPVGAVVTTRAVADSFANGMEYFNTFGGNPVSCAAASAVLEEIAERRLQDQARIVGGSLREGLARIAARSPCIGDVRGRGLFLGVELVRDQEARTPARELAGHVVEQMKRHRILTSGDGPHRNVLKIKPPLVFSEAEAARYVEALAASLAALGQPT